MMMVMMTTMTDDDDNDNEDEDDDDDDDGQIVVDTRSPSVQPAHATTDKQTREKPRRHRIHKKGKNKKRATSNISSGSRSTGKGNSFGLRKQHGKSSVG